MKTVPYLFILLLMIPVAGGAGEFMPIGAPNCGGVADWVLIYAGGVHRRDWVPEDFTTYLTWKNPETSQEDWLFDGFLFIEYKDSQGHEYAKGYGQKPARKIEWSWYLDRLFEPGKILDALDRQIGKASARIGKPRRSRRVAITLPEPIAGQTDWGELSGLALDFNTPQDRLAACQWYLDDLAQRWQKAHLKNLELVGIYWVAETSDNKGGDVLPEVGKTIRQHGWKFLWIPYWKASGAGDWKALGFDAAYQQPNHFFHPELPDSRIDEALAFAKEHRMGMEMESDKRALSNQEVFAPRLEAYLTAFSKAGAMEHSAMAHYEGGGALISLRQTDEPYLRKLYNQYCEIIVRRQRRLDSIFSGEVPAAVLPKDATPGEGSDQP